jgi:hypothetical protein
VARAQSFKAISGTSNLISELNYPTWLRYSFVFVALPDSATNTTTDNLTLTKSLREAPATVIEKSISVIIDEQSNASDILEGAEVEEGHGAALLRKENLHLFPRQFLHP